SQVGRQVWVNSREFLTKAGTTIFCLSVILWALTYYPRLPQSTIASIKSSVRENASNEIEAVEAQRVSNAKDAFERAEGVRPNIVAIEPVTIADAINQRIAAARREYSIAGRLGHWMEPVIRPLGYDWKMGIGLVGAFAAREVFVSTMGITYSVGEVEKRQTQSLAAAMRADLYLDGRPVWTPAVALSLL